MTSFKLKQIGLALCLVASLLVGSASACMCSHHQEKAKPAVTSCHGTGEAPGGNAETFDTGNALDVDCVCFVSQVMFLIVSKSESKKLKADKGDSNLDQATFDPLFAAATTVQLPLPEFDRDLSYSKVLSSLLPSRAPPRL